MFSCTYTSSMQLVIMYRKEIHTYILKSIKCSNSKEIKNVMDKKKRKKKTVYKLMRISVFLILGVHFIPLFIL